MANIPADTGGEGRLLCKSLPSQVEQAKRIIVGFSGGGDSLALLHALHHRLGPRVLALHVNHGLQACSDEWALQNERACSKFGIRFVSERARVVEQRDKGPEAAARVARYEIYKRHIEDGDVLALAHHMDDQAETVLFRLLRGAGLRGLAAMQGMRPIGEGWLWRPLLGMRQCEIRSYAKVHRLTGIRDPHNQDERFARSYLRQRLMPGVLARWPAAAQVLGRTATVLAEAADLHEEIAEQDLAKTLHKDGSLDVGCLLGLSTARRRNLLGHWVAVRQFPRASRGSILRIESEVLHARADADPCLRWPGAEVRRYRNALYLMAPLPPVKPYRLDWEGQGRLHLPDELGWLEVVGTARLRRTVTIRNSRSGDRFRPRGRPGPRGLKNLSQAHGVASWIRHRMPMIECDGKLLWVPGLGWAEGASATMGSSPQPEVQWATRLPAKTCPFDGQ